MRVELPPNSARLQEAAAPEEPGSQRSAAADSTGPVSEFDRALEALRRSELGPRPPPPTKLAVLPAEAAAAA
jgi:hypothetical protein